MYVKEGRTIRDIAKDVGCSREAVRTRCKKHDILLRPTGVKSVDLDESTLRRLYVREDKSMPEIAKILDCSVGPIYKNVKQFGLKKQPGKTIVEKLYPDLEQKKSVQSE